MAKSERFGMLLSPSEKVALEKLAHRERISAAAVVRRLIWREAEELGLVTRTFPDKPGPTSRQARSGSH
jgi:hypothetical protein